MLDYSPTTEEGFGIDNMPAELVQADGEFGRNITSVIEKKGVTTNSLKLSTVRPLLNEK